MNLIAFLQFIAKWAMIMATIAKAAVAVLKAV